jgi:hypothetical protein
VHDLQHHPLPCFSQTPRARSCAIPHGLMTEESLRNISQSSHSEIRFIQGCLEELTVHGTNDLAPQGKDALSLDELCLDVKFDLLLQKYKCEW